MKSDVYQVLAKLVHDETSATAIEYSLIAALVSVACIISLTQLGTMIFQIFAPVEEAVPKCVEVGSNCKK